MQFVFKKVTCSNILPVKRVVLNTQRRILNFFKKVDTNKHSDEHSEYEDCDTDI